MSVGSARTLPLAPPPRAVSPAGQVAVAVLPLVTDATTVVTFDPAFHLIEWPESVHAELTQE
jgi:hypothetical protein